MHHADLDFDATTGLWFHPVEILISMGVKLAVMLGTYVSQPAKWHEGMEIGAEQFRTRRDLWLDQMPIQPLRDPASGHALDLRVTGKDTAE